MAATIEQTWRLAQVAEKELHACLAEKDPALRNVDQLIAQYRSKCEDMLLQDFGFAQSKSTENRLWDAHVRINNRFRKQLNVFREAGGKKRVVEKRKTAKHYLDFIKSSQRFYRGYIQKLASNFGGIRELEAVAQKFNVDTSSPNFQSSASDDVNNSVLRSCHQTLVRLGDLSRYRETELPTKEHNWGPAIGYYDLAGAIFPASGASHNQLAVIARADSNHLRATYHLYRALAVEEPHPSARGNIEIEFKKIHTAWGKGEPVASSLHRDAQGPGKALVGWFMRLHALCYTGVDFAEHDELENEVVSQLAIDLKERSLEGALNKFVLMNIAAEYFAGNRLKGDPESQEILQSFFFFQRLNVRTMFTLLQVLQPELERQVDTVNEPENDGVPSNADDQISAVACRVLPGLRHYSSWLASNAAILTAQSEDTSLTVQIKELWKIYANTLTLLASTFQVSDLPSVDYLLEEDEDTLGFKPFENEIARRRHYYQDSNSQKPKWHHQGIDRHHPNVEMLGRIRDFLTDGLLLAFDQTVPMDLVVGTTTFAYRETGMPSELEASPEVHQAILTSTMIEPQDITHAHMSSQRDAASPVDDAASQPTSYSVSMDTEAHRMVDNLLDSETAENTQNDEDVAYRDENRDNVRLGPLGSTFLATPSRKVDDDTTYGFNETLNASDFVRALHKYSPQEQPQGSPRPHLPSIYHSPFAPQADDAASISRPTTAKRMSPLHSRHSSQHKFALQLPHQSGHVVDSSISSMQESSGLGISQTPVYKANNQFMHGRAGSHHGAVGDRVVGNNRNGTVEDNEFPSSTCFAGSPFDCSGQSVRYAANMQTPPNGQGGG